ncbi:hypothetical protein RRF57_007069 [Xylaria bambusicola]|uniref:Uncharacterized protein n=1 Tax=Xylaria bambusicola TaxID=326684 RepID=A0AAN7YZH1_9PEZI
MPSMTRIVIKYFRPDLRKVYPEQLDQSDSLPHHLISRAYELWLGNHLRQQLPFHLVSELLLSLQRHRLPLERLDIATPPTMSWLPTSSTATTPEPAVLRHALRGLKTFVYCPAAHRRFGNPLIKVPKKWTEFAHFLLSVLDPESVQKIELDFYFLPAQVLLPKFSMTSILTSYSWPKLQQLSFYGSFHFNELKAIVEPLRQDVELQ